MSVAIVAAVLAATVVARPQAADPEAGRRKAERCASCHGAEKPKGDLDLTRYPTIDAVAKDARRWKRVALRSWPSRC